MGHSFETEAMGHFCIPIGQIEGHDVGVAPAWIQSGCYTFGTKKFWPLYILAREIGDKDILAKVILAKDVLAKFTIKLKFQPMAF